MYDHRSVGGPLRRLGRWVALTLGLAMSGFGAAAGWKTPKVDKPPIEWARDRDPYDPPARIIPRADDVDHRGDSDTDTRGPLPLSV
jgi:hypothetical protein